MFVVMEYADGGSLLDHVRARKRLSERESARMFRQMCAGLMYCHANGVVHRDVKLENVLLDANANVKIIDFGLSAVLTPGRRLRGARFLTPVPTRPRSRGARRSLTTSPARVALRPPLDGFNPDTPRRRLSTPLLTPLMNPARPVKSALRLTVVRRAGDRRSQGVRRPAGGRVERRRRALRDGDRVPAVPRAERGEAGAVPEDHEGRVYDAGILREGLSRPRREYSASRPREARDVRAGAGEQVDARARERESGRRGRHPGCRQGAARGCRRPRRAAAVPRARRRRYSWRRRVGRIARRVARRRGSGPRRCVIYTGPHTTAFAW
eukprot:30587-Pelagococcus_subviridis.AAC.2